MKKIGKTKNKNKVEEENIWNIPNTLTLMRVLITFITIYFIFAGYDIVIIVILFSVGMLTDFFDGQIARRFNMATEFGRKFDVMADRFLMVGVAMAFILDYSIKGTLTQYHIMQIILIMSRELIALPVAIILLSSGKEIPKVKWVGKITTALQGFTFPAIMLSISYPLFSFSIFLALATSICGIASGLTFINDVIKNQEKK